MTLRFRAICSEGCGVLHVTDQARAANLASAGHGIAPGHAATVQARLLDYAPNRC